MARSTGTFAMTHRAVDAPSRPVPATNPRRWVRRGLRACRRQPIGVFGLFIVVSITVLAVTAPYWAGDPESLSTARLVGPSSENWFGTDLQGRDYFARVLIGTRVSLGLTLAAMVVATSLALAGGVLGAYLGGIVDLVIQRAVDVLLAFPGLVLVLTFAAVFGTGVGAIALALGVLIAPGMTRLVRGSALSVMAEPFVEAAEVSGASPRRIMIVHVLPNIAPTVLIYVTAGMGTVFLAEGALSFLGMGIAPPTPSLGRMLAESRVNWREPWLAAFPGLAITVAVLGFNLLGDALRDIWDPRMRGSGPGA